jgi:hypothetical protein
MESSFIDPGIGTAPKPDAGPSSGQVPRVALDESSEIVACLNANGPAVAMREFQQRGVVGSTRERKGQVTWIRLLLRMKAGAGLRRS